MQIKSIWFKWTCVSVEESELTVHADMVEEIQVEKPRYSQIKVKKFESCFDVRENQTY